MRIALTLAALLLATPVAADEVWRSEMGDFVYEKDEGGAAYISFTNVDAYPAMLVIPGLAGNYDNRSVHEAFWIGTGAGYCDGFMGLADSDEMTTNWGRALVSFDGPAFPTSFTLTLGDCFGPLNYALRATAR